MRDEHKDASLGFDLFAQCVAPRHDRYVAVLLGDGEAEDREQDDDDLDAIPEQHLAPRQQDARVGWRGATGV